MRIGIFSDVHSNIEALKNVIAKYESLQIDKYVCLGDVVGYGAAPNICCNLVRNLVEHCVLGNHDAAVSGRMDYGYYYDAARNALDHHASLISDENRAWLKSLPYTAIWEDVCFSHGSPINVQDFDYVFNPAQAMSLLPHYEKLQNITFIGHSHLTKIFVLHPPGYHGPRVEEALPPHVSFLPDRKYIVTVGSVGQPRDNDARSCFTVYDSEKKTIDYHRVGYDIGTSAMKIFEMTQLAPDFGKRLFLGI